MSQYLQRDSTDPEVEKLRGSEVYGDVNVRAELSYRQSPCCTWATEPDSPALGIRQSENTENGLVNEN